MKRKPKRWSDLTTDELALATRSFDDPVYQPPGLRPPQMDLAQLRRVRRRAAKDRFRVAVALDGDLIEEADQYALNHGISFSDLIASALRQLMKKKSA
jgi:hypothetical protein